MFKTGKLHTGFAGTLCRTVGLLLALALAGCQNLKPLPPGLSFSGAQHPTENVTIVSDQTWLDNDDERHVDQKIYDDMLQIIGEANQLIVMDMFLYNDFQGPVPETERAIAGEITDALIKRKEIHPLMNIVVITDPVNEVYGGLPSPYFAKLRNAGIRVVVTDLPALRDSNAVYSFFWRLFIRPFGNGVASTLPNPFGQGRVSLRSYLALLNFKANHRKVLIADSDDSYIGFVSSANPHDGSSAHRNIAIKFSGAAVQDLLETENAVLQFSGAETVEYRQITEDIDSSTTVQVVTEGKIRDAILQAIESANKDHRIDLMMFYLSDRKIIAALKNAHQRGANIRVLLDPNKDAFGREKNGIPNRPVAYELNASGIPVRWCYTKGEQCHAKMILIDDVSGHSIIISGSANYTRRNLADFNLETNVVVRGDSNDSVFRVARDLFSREWNNTRERQYSLPYERFEDDSVWRRWGYRFMERSGVSAF